jgi:hypothetical protein
MADQPLKTVRTMVEMHPKMGNQHRKMERATTEMHRRMADQPLKTVRTMVEMHPKMGNQHRKMERATTEMHPKMGNQHQKKRNPEGGGIEFEN